MRLALSHECVINRTTLFKVVRKINIEIQLVWSLISLLEVNAFWLVAWGDPWQRKTPDLWRREYCEVQCASPERLGNV